MTEQPPSAEALTLLMSYGIRWQALAREIDTLCEQRVATAERGDDGSDQSDSPSPFLARLNGLQRTTVENLRETLRGAHYTNIIVRAGGRDHYFEADWLHHALNILCKRHRGDAPPERTD